MSATIAVPPPMRPPRVNTYMVSSTSEAGYHHQQDIQHREVTNATTAGDRDVDQKSDWGASGSALRSGITAKALPHTTLSSAAGIAAGRAV